MDHKDFGPSSEYPIFEMSHQFHIFRDQVLVATRTGMKTNTLVIYFFTAKKFDTRTFYEEKIRFAFIQPPLGFLPNNHVPIFEHLKKMSIYSAYSDEKNSATALKHKMHRHKKMLRLSSAGSSIFLLIECAVVRHQCPCPKCII